MSTVAKKPTIKKQQDSFIEQAGSKLVEGKTKKTKPKKAQIPVIIPPILLKNLDEHIEESMVGLSRSAWICQAIKEKLDKDS